MVQQLDDSVTVTPLTQQFDASIIVTALKDQANKILSSILGTTPLQGFAIGKEGLFPYYWQNSTDLTFNPKTYDWISSALASGADPKQLSGVFTNEYITLITKLSYSYSKADQAKVNEAATKTQSQAADVLRTWQSNIGAFPTGDGKPIDNILTVIQTKWADPAKQPVTLMDIRDSANLNQLLSNTPPSGFPVIQVLSNYLNALGSVLGLTNSLTFNSGVLQSMQNAINDPTAANGGLTLHAEPGATQGQVVPRYNVATQLPDIQNGLANKSQAAELSMSVSRFTRDEYSVTVKGGGGFSIPVLDFIGISFGNTSSYFQDHIATTDNETTVEMTFPGVTLVSYGPADQTLSGVRQNWFNMAPIKEALQNANKDVTGFKFDTPPTIDLSANGPFGYIQGAAICSYPTVVITVKSSNYERIEKDISTQTHFGFSFLGIPIGAQGTVSTYSSSVQTDASSQTVKITLNPPPTENATVLDDSTAWILGVQAVYPAA